MTFTPENDLERALIQAAGDPIAQVTFYRLLLESELFALGRAEQDASPQPGAEAKLHIAQMVHKERIYHPIFSAAIRLQSYAQEHPQYFAIKGRDLFTATRGAYFVLNPGSEYAKELLPPEIAALLQWESSPSKESRPGEVLITRPTVFPAALADALRRLFATRPEIEAAYLGQMAIGGAGDPPHPIVGVKLNGPWEPLAREIERVVEPFPQGTRLAALPITEEGPRKVIGEALMRFEPLYARKSGLH